MCCRLDKGASSQQLSRKSNPCRDNFGVVYSKLGREEVLLLGGAVCVVFL